MGFLDDTIGAATKVVKALIPIKFKSPPTRIPTTNGEQLARLQEAIEDIKGDEWYKRGNSFHIIEKSQRDHHGIYEEIKYLNTEGKIIKRIQNKLTGNPYPLIKYTSVETIYDLDGNIIAKLHLNVTYSNEDEINRIGGDDEPFFFLRRKRLANYSGTFSENVNSNPFVLEKVELVLYEQFDTI